VALRSTAVVLVFVLVVVIAAVVEAGGALSVNGVEVSAAEVGLARQWAKLEAPADASDDARVTALAVDRVVADILLAGEAATAGETVTKKEIKEGIAAFRSRVGGDAPYKEVLSKTGASEDDLARLVERHRLARRYVEQRIAPTVTVSEAEARAWYEQPGNQIYHMDQIKVRLIFVNGAANDPAETQAKAQQRVESAAARIGAGEDFAAVAREVSEDLSRENGGELGWLSRGVFPRALEGTVWGLEPGETSGVLRGPYGFALIQVVDRRAAGPSPFEEARGSVISSLQSDKTKQAVNARVAELRSKATIAVLDPALGWSPE
jgi:parvulin-like peptidyl-prolyl isomerase